MSLKSIEANLNVSPKLYRVPARWTAPSEPDLKSLSQEKCQQLIIAGVVGFYFLTSLAVVFLNKFIMSTAPASLNLPLPFFVTYLQVVVAFLILFIGGNLSKRIPSLALVTPYEFNWQIAKRVMPLALAYVCMLGLNNLCLMHVEVTFYQVARSLSLVFTTIFTKVILKKQVKRRVIKACALVFAGFLLGSIGEMRFTMFGAVCGVASSVFVALYGIYVKQALSQVDNNQWRLLHYNTTLSLFLLLPLILISGEFSQLVNYEKVLYNAHWWLLILVTGLTGFLINISVFLQIKVTTPLTNTISGTAKACVQTLLAAIIYRNPISFTNGSGIALCLAGSAYYSFVKYQEMQSL